MKKIGHYKLLGITILAVSILGMIGLRFTLGAANANTGKTAAQTMANKPVLTITAIRPTSAEWPMKLSATGDIEAWQEALIGSEVNGLKITEVKVNVGDMVQRGQLLATLSDVTVKAEVAQAQAAVAEAEALLADARANADRTRRKESPTIFSGKQISEYLTSERTATARLESARAQLAHQRIRLEQTQLTAPDPGLISARHATAGAVVSTGQELFRLIRFNRLEWRAKVTAAELPYLKAGQQAVITAPGGIAAHGTVRMIAPTVDPKSRMALIYVDVPADQGLKPGMFAQGEFELGRTPVMALPQTAVVQREGFNYVYRVGADNKVVETKVEIGRRLDGAVEIVHGLDQEAQVVAAGAPFLTDGDTVRLAALTTDASRQAP